MFGRRAGDLPLSNKEGGGMHVLITGGAGFIGSHLIRMLLWEEPEWRITNLDKLTYAGDLTRLEDISDNSRYRFVRGDIGDSRISNHLKDWEVDAVVNLAAESHVDRSISGSRPFLE